MTLTENVEPCGVKGCDICDRADVTDCVFDCPCDECTELGERIDHLVLDQVTDATQWAEAFADRFDGLEVTQDALVTWFANAIENGRDRGYAQGYRDAEPKVEVTYGDLCELAGSLSVPFLTDHPDYVLPVEDLLEITADFFNRNALSQ